MSLRSQSVFVPCGSALLALCAGAHPQSPPYSEVDNTVKLAQLTGSFKRTCTGDLDADHASDVAMLGDGRVFVAFDVSAHENLVEIVQAVPVTDLALTPKMDPVSRCEIALVRSDGLFLVGRQPDPQNPAPWVTEEVLPLDATLDGATLVRSADLDGNGRSDLMVVLANQKTVRVLLRQLDGSWSTALAPFTMATNVSDIVGLQYDNDAPLELAIQTAGSARVHELSGTFVAMARNATSGAPAAMAVMPVLGTQRSRVAYLGTAAAGGYDLHLLEFLVAQQTLNVGNLVPRALLAEDYDGDTDYDLLVDHGGSGAVTLLWSNELLGCQPSSNHHFSCQLGQQVPFQAGPQGAVMHAIAWTDLDNDGKPDLLVPSSEAVSGTWIAEFRPRVPAPEGVGGLPTEPEPHPVFKLAEWADPSTSYPAAAPQLRLYITDVWPDSRDYLQVTVWRKETPPSGMPGAGTETIGRYNGFYERAEIPTASVSIDNVPFTCLELTLPPYMTGGSGTNYTPFQLMSNVLAYAGTDTTLFFVEVRSVELDEEFEIVSAGRKQLTGLALNGEGSAQGTASTDYLLTLPENWGVNITANAFDSGFTGLGEYKIGGLVPMPAMPAFAPGYLVYTEPVIIP